MTHPAHTASDFDADIVADLVNVQANWDLVGHFVRMPNGQITWVSMLVGNPLPSDALLGLGLRTDGCGNMAITADVNGVTCTLGTLQLDWAVNRLLDSDDGADYDYDSAADALINEWVSNFSLILPQA